MRIVLAWAAGRGSGIGLERAAEAYVERLGQYLLAELKVFRSEESLLEFVAKLRGRTAPGRRFLRLLLRVGLGGSGMAEFKT
jgi:hypothetical protein